MTKIWPLTIALAGLASATAAAQQHTAPPSKSAGDVLRSAGQGSGDIEQLIAGLHSPNPSVRVSTFTQMVESNNPSLTTIAINEAHASTDASLRDMSARAAFRELRNYMLDPIGEISAENQNSYNYFIGQGLRGEIKGYDWQHGMFEVGAGAGQISGTRFTFHASLCQGNLTAAEGTWSYDGVVVCLNGNIKLTTRMRLTIR